MGYVLDDLLDYNEIKAGTFCKKPEKFNLHEAISEVMSLQQEKALLKNINLGCHWKPQSISSRPGSRIISLFKHYDSDSNLSN